jgi:hypothetical protein
MDIHEALEQVQNGDWDAESDAISGAAFGYLAGKGMELNEANYDIALRELGITDDSSLARR